MKIFIRQLILFLFFPTIWISSKIQIPFKRRKLKSQDYQACFQAEICTIFLTRQEGVLSNYLIPGGFWTHSAIKISKNSVAESTSSKGVKETNIENFLANKDYVKIVSVPFEYLKSENDLRNLFQDVEKTPYDWEFIPSSALIYCAELVVFLLGIKEENLRLRIKRTILDVWTIVPSDFEYFPFIKRYDSRDSEKKILES